MPPENPNGDELIYISALARIVNRELNTIRMWERTGKLPKHLHPKRGERGWRYWTHAQVYGDRGIIKWMEKNDMRPGRVLADPAHEDAHVLALRRPKYLDNRLIKNVRTMVKNKATSEQIVEEMYPHTKYVSPENLEAALRSYFKKQGWVFPPRQRRKKTKK